MGSAVSPFLIAGTSPSLKLRDPLPLRANAIS